MRKPSARSAKFISLATAPVAVLVASALVWQGSNAAFSSSTRNSGNAWTTGSVTLTDDDNGVAGFTVTNLVPMQAGEKCITVTSTSGTPGTVHNYVANLNVSDQGLEKYITLDVQTGSGGSFGSCTGFVDDGTNIVPPYSLSVLAVNYNNFANGGAEWKTVGNPDGESKTFKISYQFDTSKLTQSEVNALQGSTVSIDAVWELQND